MEQQNKLYVGNFPFSWKEDDLEQVFSEYKNNIVDIKIIYDQFSGRSKGFAFITFDDEGAATKALEKADTKAVSRTIQRRTASARSDQRPTLGQRPERPVPRGQRKASVNLPCLRGHGMGRMATRRNTTRRICLELRLTGEAVNPPWSTARLTKN